MPFLSLKLQPPFEFSSETKKGHCTSQGALASEQSKKKKEKNSPAWALHLLSQVFTEAAVLFSGPLFPSGSDDSDASCSSTSKLWINS